MILQSLRDLAVREQLIDDPAFENKAVRWIIELKSDGGFVDAYDTNKPEQLPEGSKKKPRMQAKLMLIPRRLGRSSGIRADFLVDNAKYALGFEADPAEADDPRVTRCHTAFVDFLRAVPRDMSEIRSVLAFLEDHSQRAACEARLKALGGFASNDLFGFQVETFPLTEVEALRGWWGERHRAVAESGEPVQCLVCGEHRPPARLHNSFQIRGASTAGVPLVSFNTGAFEKYGLGGNENAPVCTVCMTGYTEALRRLTRRQYETSDGRKLTPLSTVLNDDTTALYWSESQSDVLSLVRALQDPKSVAGLLKAPHQGQRAVLSGGARFYCLVLTGAQGRVSIRHLHTGTVGEVERNLRHYFRTIHVDRYNLSEPMPLFRLLQAMVLNGERDRLPSHLGTELWLHALFRTPLSRSFLSCVVSRNRAERTVKPERAALLHLYFAQSTKLADATELNSPNEESDRPMSLDRESKDPPYLLGRLLAALESLQTAAQGGNLNRTLVDRTFGAASTRPGVVFPQLIQTAQHHLSKASRRASGRAVCLDRLLGEITDGLSADGFSAVLSLEQQGRFALGYYHQRQSFFRKNDATESTTSTISDTSKETEA